MSSLKASLVFVVMVLVLGGGFRFYNLDWDEGNHLHPDERFLTMVANAMKVPESFIHYLNPTISTFNPSNIGFPFFVYGIFPLSATVLITNTLGLNTYHDFTFIGRMISGLVDMGTLMVVLLTARLIQRRYRLPYPNFALWASFFYAVAVLPIQLSHFFATDTFLTFFLSLTVYLFLKTVYTQRILYVLLGGVSWGLALATKVSAVYFLPLVIAIVLLPREGKIDHLTLKHRRSIVHAIGFLLLFAVSAYMTVRLANPYMFESASFFDFRINQALWQNLQWLRGLEDESTSFPPAIQWIDTAPIWFSLKNMAALGFGLPQFLLLVLGTAWLFYHNIKQRQVTHLTLLAGFTLGYFIYQSTTFIKIMRYFYFLYPFMVIISAYGTVNLIHRIKQRYKVPLQFLILCLSLLWPLMFLSIYINSNSRVTASHWMVDQIPSDSVIAVEHWDDGLPLGGVDKLGKQFHFVELPVFGADTAEKWGQINEGLSQADYYVLSSNRAWGSMPRLPDQYPKTTQFYADLFSERLTYTKVAEFTSYPSLSYLGIPIILPDQWADESFTVYDHPKVMIYQNTAINKKFSY
jgi:hypothetical protein